MKYFIKKEFILIKNKTIYGKEELKKIQNICIAFNSIVIEQADQEYLDFIKDIKETFLNNIKPNVKTINDVKTLEYLKSIDTIGIFQKDIEEVGQGLEKMLTKEFLDSLNSNDKNKIDFEKSLFSKSNENIFKKNIYFISEYYDLISDNISYDNRDNLKNKIIAT